MCQYLVAWLYFSASVSRRTASVVATVLGILLTTFFRTVTTILHLTSSGCPDIPAMHMPRDIQTIRRHLHLDATILRTISCTKCFKQYPLNHASDICMYRKTPRSDPCNTHLFEEKTYRAAGTTKKPRLLYSTQCFESWLSHFLKRPGIEDAISNSYVPENSQPPPIMRSIWDSPSWRSGFEADPGYSCRIGNLTFALYIDWFNPFGNAEAGVYFSEDPCLFYILKLELLCRPSVLCWHYCSILPQSSGTSALPPG